MDKLSVVDENFFFDMIYVADQIILVFPPDDRQQLLR